MNVLCMLWIYYIVNIFWEFGENLVKSNLIEVPLDKTTMPIEDYEGTNIQSCMTSCKHISYNREELFALKDKQHDQGLSRQLPFGAIDMVRKLKLNRKTTNKFKTGSYRNRKVIRRGVYSQNLITIQNDDSDQIQTRKGLSIATVNARSIRNKDHLVMNEIERSNIDYVVITETWLDGEKDDNWVNQSCLTQSGYQLNRQDRNTRGGGLAILHRDKTKIIERDTYDNDAYENCVWTIEHRKERTSILGIYRPPSLNINEFVDNLSEQLSTLLQTTKNLIICGDFNIHIKDCTSNEVLLFNSTMEAFGLTQLVDQPTHTNGNILDLIFISEIGDSKVTSLEIGPMISDHRIVIMELSKARIQINRKTIEVRKTSDVTTDEFMSEFKKEVIELNEGLPTVHNQFKSGLQRALEDCVPKKTLTIGDRKKHQWVDNTVLQQRRIVRNRERIWKRYHKEHQWKAYKRERNRLNRMLIYNKKNEVSGKVQDYSKDAKKLYKYITKITNSTKLNPLPENANNEVLAEEFADYFHTKIMNIRENLSNIENYKPDCNESIPLLKSFAPMTQKEISLIINSMPSKCCELDPIPTDLFKMILPNIIEMVTHIVNRSLTEGEFIR